MNEISKILKHIREQLIILKALWQATFLYHRIPTASWSAGAHALH